VSDVATEMGLDMELRVLARRVRKWEDAGVAVTMEDLAVLYDSRVLWYKGQAISTSVVRNWSFATVVRAVRHGELNHARVRPEYTIWLHKELAEGGAP
jgi:hypothetical protein